MQAILMFVINPTKEYKWVIATCYWTNLSIIHCFVGLSGSTFCSCRSHYFTNLEITEQIKLIFLSTAATTITCPYHPLASVRNRKWDKGYPPVAFLLACHVTFPLLGGNITSAMSLSCHGYLFLGLFASTIRIITIIVTLSHLVSMLFH